LENVVVHSTEQYRIAMVLLMKREDFTNAMIATYQNHADKFYQAWLIMWQKEGILLHKLLSHNWFWARCRLSLQMEELVWFLTTRLGSN